MARTLTSAVLAQVNSNANRSCWLAMIAFDDPLYCCNWPVDLSWDGHTWQALDLKVTQLKADAAGTAGATLALGNADNTIGALVLAGGLMDRQVDLYLAYVDDQDQVIADPELLLSGRANGGHITVREVTIGVLEDRSARHGWIPRRWLGPDTGFNHLPPDGQVIQWKSEKYVLKSRE